MKLKIFLLLLSAVALITACENEQQLEFKRYYSSGSVVYQNHCQNCHGANGEGLAGLIPPLTDTLYIKKHIHQLPCYVQNGFKDTITINNRKFDGEMYAVKISPFEIAQVLTYVANSFGNNAGTIDIQKVQADLGECK